MSERHFDYEDVLLISFNATAEVGCYLKQTLELTRRRIEGVFGKDKERQEGLGKWFG